MRLSFQKEEALQSIQPLQGIVGSRSMLPILSHVILEAGPKGANVIASDLELWMSRPFPAKVEEAGATSIPGRRFFNIIREFPAPEIRLEAGEDNVARISCQRSLIKMIGLPREEFPAQPDLGEALSLKIRQPALKDLIRKTSYAISQDETRYVLNGLYLLFEKGKVTAVATDGRRLALTEAEAEMDEDLKKEVILPFKAVQELGRSLEEEGEMTVELGDRNIKFKSAETTMISRLIEGRFPNYKQVIPPTEGVKIKLPRLDFLQVIRRASLITDEKSNSVKFNFQPGQVVVSAVTPEVGEAREEMSLEYSGKPVEIAFNPNYMMDVLKSLEEEEHINIELVDSNSPGIFRTDGRFLCVIMPMKLS